MLRTPLPGYLVLNKMYCSNAKRKIINRLANTTKRTFNIGLIVICLKTLSFKKKLKKPIKKKTTN